MKSRLIVVDNLPDGTADIVANKTLTEFWTMEDGHKTSELWYLKNTPIAVAAPRHFQQKFDFNLSPGEVRFGHSQFPPLSEVKKLYQQHGVEFDEQTYAKHSTTTIDFLVLIKGELKLLTENTAVHLYAGDCIVQKATIHAWINPGHEIAEMVYVMIGADMPPGFKPFGTPTPLAIHVDYPPQEQ